MSTAENPPTPVSRHQLPYELGFLALGADRRTLLLTHDHGVAAYGYDPERQRFEFESEGKTHGAGTHVAITPSGRQVLVAHYAAGLLSVLGYDPQAGFTSSRSESPGLKAHQVCIDSAGRHAYVPCLGSNYVAVYDLHASSEPITPNRTPTVAAPGGPRHMVLHPRAAVAYVLTELSSQIHVFDIDERGSLLPRPNASVFTSADGGPHWSSDVKLTPNGEHLYAVNRDPPEIVHFRVQRDGSLERALRSPLSAPVRAFAMDPEGAFLQVGGEDGRLITFSIEPSSGALTERHVSAGLENIRATVITYL